MWMHILTLNFDGDSAKGDTDLGSVVPRTQLAPTQHVAGCAVRVDLHKDHYCRLHRGRRTTDRRRCAFRLVIHFLAGLTMLSSHQAVIPGAVNLPAQTFYPLLPTLSSLLASIPIVVFHCSSSLGRAPRCAGWFADALPSDSECKVFILQGGMKAWRARFEEDRKMVTVMPLEKGEGIGAGAGVGNEAIRKAQLSLGLGIQRFKT